MQQTADVTVKVPVFPERPLPEKLPGFRFRILNTDLPDCIYEVISAAERWDIRYGIQYDLHCKVILDTEAPPSIRADQAHH